MLIKGLGRTEKLIAREDWNNENKNNINFWLYWMDFHYCDCYSFICLLHAGRNRAKTGNHEGGFANRP